MLKTVVYLRLGKAKFAKKKKRLFQAHKGNTRENAGDKDFHVIEPCTTAYARTPCKRKLLRLKKSEKKEERKHFCRGGSKTRNQVFKVEKSITKKKGGEFGEETKSRR